MIKREEMAAFAIVVDPLLVLKLFELELFRYACLEGSTPHAVDSKLDICHWQLETSQKWSQDAQDSDKLAWLQIVCSVFWRG